MAIGSSAIPSYRVMSGSGEAITNESVGGRIPCRSTLPIVVLVSKDVPALPILPVLNPALLTCAHMPIGACTRFGLGDTCLSAFEM